jgi:hypothetical protein
LQGRLSAAQSHLHKEAIRTAYVALAQHDAKTGELRDALGYLLRATDYCTTRSQTAHISLLVLELALALENYSQVREYVTKVEHTLGSSAALTTAPTGAAGGGGGAASSPYLAAGDTTAQAAAASTAAAAQQITIKLKIASGLEKMAQGDYSGAAKALTTLISTTCSTTWSWQSVICPEDIALYAAVLSLATQGRSHIVQLSQHPEALELVPAMKELMVQFARANYQACCASFRETSSISGISGSGGGSGGVVAATTSNAATSHFFPDFYLHRHWDILCAKIREKCIMEYLKPYQCVQLDKMAREFQFPADELQEVLVDLIGRGLVPKARINVRTRVLEKSTNENDEESSDANINHKLATMERRVLDDTYALLVRLSCLEHDISVQDTQTVAARSSGRGRGAASARMSYPDIDQGAEYSSSDEEGDTPMLDVSSHANPEDLY